MSAGKVMLVTVIAMATGAVLGVLFAPGKGSTTRKKLSKEGTRYVGAVKNAADEAVATFEEKVDNVKEIAVGLSDTVMEAVDSLSGHEPEKHTRRA
jgi:gas vesicle protein